MTKRNPALDAILRENDHACIERGEPILSVIIRDDTGKPCHIFWESVEKYKLRRPGEDAEQLTQRLLDAAYAFHQQKRN